MPKGSPPNIVHAKTWSGKVLPGRTKAQLAARTKNMSREMTPSKYDGAATARDVRGSESTGGTLARVNENPMKALKRRASMTKGKK